MIGKYQAALRDIYYAGATNDVPLLTGEVCCLLCMEIRKGVRQHANEHKTK